MSRKAVWLNVKPGEETPPDRDYGYRFSIPWEIRFCGECPLARYVQHLGLLVCGIMPEEHSDRVHLHMKVEDGKSPHCPLKEETP